MLNESRGSQFFSFSVQNYCFFTIFAKMRGLDKFFLFMKSTERKFYKIGDVAEILNIPASTLRFWEKKFSLLRPKRTNTNMRYYTLDDIERIRMIYYLVKERGLTLKAAEEQVVQNRNGVSRRREVIERLKQVDEELKRMLAALDAIAKANR